MAQALVVPEVKEGDLCLEDREITAIVLGQTAVAAEAERIQKP